MSTLTGEQYTAEKIYIDNMFYGGKEYNGEHTNNKYAILMAGRLISLI